MAPWTHFLAYVEQILAPTLKKDDIVFMDNVSTHLVDGVEETIEDRGRQRLLSAGIQPRL